MTCSSGNEKRFQTLERYTFTPNGRREFVARDQIFRLLFIASTQNK